MMLGDAQRKIIERTKVLFIHNIMAPYRLPIFRKLAEGCDLKMYFIHRTHNYRRWKIFQEDLEFKYIVSRGIDVGVVRIPLNLCRELTSKKYDIIILGEAGVETLPASLIAILLKYVRHSKIILMIERFENRSVIAQPNLAKKCVKAVFKAYLRFLYRHCDAFVACSSKTADYLRHMSIVNQKIFESAQAVFDILQTPCDDEVQKKKNVITILTVAYLEDRKGIDNLIRAFKTMNNSDTELIIAGDGGIRCKLESIAEGRNNIIFKGHVDGVEKRNLYEGADIFVLPSHFETWGLVVNEAMHYGLPVIITDAMGSTDLIDGNGIIIPAGDINALLQALRRLVDSRELRSKMSERSRKIICSIDLNAVTVPFIKAIRYVSGEKCRQL